MTDNSFSLNLNLLRFYGATICPLTGKSGATKDCIVIPVEDNQVYVTKDEQGQPRGAFVRAALRPFANGQDSNGNTHHIRLYIGGEKRQSMTEEEVKQIPYIGSAKPFIKPDINGFNKAANDAAPYVGNNLQGDALPF